MKSQTLKMFKQAANVSFALSLILVGSAISKMALAQDSTNINLTESDSASNPTKTPAESAESQAPATATRDKMSDARPKETKDLPNFHQVHPYLYRGGEPSPKGMKQLSEMGVKTLIDLRAPTEAAHNEKKLAKELGMTYINLTMTAEAPTKKQVDTLLKTVDEAREKNEPVLVHCAHGSDRTGCMIGIIRVTRDNWGFDDTYKEMRKYWFGTKYLKLKDAVKKRASR